jgi:hypothetical protein
MDQVNNWSVFDLACGLQQTGDDDMPSFVGNSAGTVAMAMSDGSRRELSRVEYEEIYRQPIPTMLSDADWAAMPQWVPTLTSIPPIVVPPADVDEAAIAAAVVAAMPPYPTPPPYPTYVSVDLRADGTLG